jgi:hypothetical protein
VQPPASYLIPAKGDDDKKPPMPNPNYEAWIAKDQQVLSYLLSSLSRDILSQVATTVETVAAAHEHVRVPIQGVCDLHSDGFGDDVQGGINGH